MPDSPPLLLTMAGLTDVGRTRSRNEDSFAVLPALGLGVVCDGMGGHAGGDVASRTAAAAITDFIAEFAPGGGHGHDALGAGAGDDDRTVDGGRGGVPSVARNAASVARSAVVLANRRIFAMNRDRGFPEGRGMGTTVAGLWRVAGTDRIVVFHAGDSRLYRLRNGMVRAMTRDHSLYQLWLDSGRRGPAPQRNVIVRALGTSGDLDPEISLLTVQRGDVFLLCSDGLNGMVDDAAIGAALDQHARPDPAVACRHLVEMANAAGGHDNITTVVTCFDA